jgi:hypothetical protein
MAQMFTAQSLNTLFSFPFKDPRWKEKFLIGIVITFVSFLLLFIPFIFVVGYTYQIMRRIILENGEPYLPEWEDWGKLFTDGLRLTGAGLVLSAPLIILFLIAFLTNLILSLVFASSSQSSSMTSLVFPIWTLFSFIPLGLGMASAMVIGIVSPVVLGHVVATNSWAAVFQVKEWWKVFRANLGGFLITYLLVIGIYFMTMIAVKFLNFTIIFCCFTPIIMGCFIFYISLISYALFGKAYRAGIQNLASGQRSNSPL